jgi:CSLREA domain-containing protein
VRNTEIHASGVERITAMRAKRAAKGKTLALGSLVAALMAACLVLLVAEPAHADKTFFVNSTKDRPDERPGDGSCYTGVRIIREGIFIELECTLRAAIQEANALAGADTINFGIPSAEDPNCSATTGVCTISPASELPRITQAVTIDGYSQPGATPNTLTQPGKTNTVLKIELRGPGTNPFAVGFVDGLAISFDTSNVVVRGLAINNFSVSGIDVGGTGHRVEGNFIGTDALGVSDRGNGNDGVFVGGSNTTIGDTTPAARNLISGNEDAGVVLAGGSPRDNEVQGNLIGTDKNGTADLGNRGEGVALSQHQTVGDDDPSDGATNAANTIAFNGGAGVRACGGDLLRNSIFSNDLDGVMVVGNCTTGSRILRNSIYDNGELGVDLVGGDETTFGVTRNDPQDPDTGNNDFQNYPGISSAVTSGGSTTVTGGLNSTPNRTFIIQFFSSPAPDPSGSGEGKTFIGQRSVTTNARGNASFSFVPARAVPVGWRVTATATGAGGTSEFSRARIVTRPVSG